jgi:hypothetical protein
LERLSDFVLPALRGARANLLPGLLLQAFALAVVVGYGQLEDVRVLLDQVGSLKQQWGYVYSLLATVTFGGVIPYFILSISGRVPPGQRRAQLLFYIAFWAWKGLEVDAFYRAQALLFGDDGSVQVVATKAAFDQLLYTPLWATPTQTLFFLWKDCKFSFPAVLAELRDEHGFSPLWRRLFTVLVSNWGVWIPAVSIIYALPSALQLPLFNLVLCFWSLLLSFVSRAPAQKANLSADGA